MSSMAYQREPIHLSTHHLGAGLFQVVRGDEVIVAETNSSNFVADAIRELRLRGTDGDTSVVIWGICSNQAFNGALKHHGA